MSSSSTSGSVRGWTPSAHDEHAVASPYSQFYATSSAPSSQLPTPPLVPAPSSSSSSNSRPSTHRHSLSLTLPAHPPPTRHYRPSSHPSPTERRAQRKRDDDPNWVPRPPNSFMIFRREFSREHARLNADGEPIPEKHLSKRAGEAWARLSDKEQRVYKVLADKAREDHAIMFPDYKYKPRRRKGSSARRSSAGGLSRREQVESFMEKVGAMADSDSESSAPTSSQDSQESFRSTSPDSFALDPRSTTPMRSLRRRRSYSLPLRAPPSKSTYFLQPTACASTSGIDKRSRSAATRPPSLSLSSGYFGMPLTPFNDPSIDESVFQFSMFDSNSTAPSSPNTSLFDFSFDESFVSTSSVPSPNSCSSIIPGFTVPDIDLGMEPMQLDSISPLEAIPIPPSMTLAQPSSGDVNPNIHRRQRSNTTSALPVSPLSVVTSSLANWDGRALGPSASTGSLPTFTHSASSPDLTTQYPSMAHYSSNPYTMDRQRRNLLPAVSESLLVPGVEMDLDKTPKVFEFPSDVQSGYTLPSSESLPSYDYAEYPVAPADIQAAQDLQSYATALEALRITPSPYGVDTQQSIADHMYNSYIVSNPTPPPM